jgi:hypothetical protein
MTPEGTEPEAAVAAPPEETAAAPATDHQEPEAAPAAPHPVPWEDAGISRFRGLFRTLGRVLFHPREFYAQMPREGWAEALAFALIVGTTGLLASFYWQLLLYLGLNRILGGMPAMLRLFSTGVGAIMAMMFLSPAIILVNLGIGSLALWGAAAFTGAKGAGFTPVWRLNCYAQGAMALGFLPLLGGPAAGFWTIVLVYRGLRGVLGLSSWRSLGALILSLIFQVLLLLLLLGSLAGFRLFHA